MKFFLNHYSKFFITSIGYMLLIIYSIKIEQRCYAFATCHPNNIGNRYCDGDSTYFYRYIEKLFSNVPKIKMKFC